MKRQEKRVNIYHLLLLLTALFLFALFSVVNRGGEADSNALYTVTTEKQTDVETAPKRVKININTATAEELEALSGVGPALAQAIVDYREEYGDFAAEEDLLNVKGIGEAKLAGFRAEITLSDEEENP